MALGKNQGLSPKAKKNDDAVKHSLDLHFLISKFVVQQVICWQIEISLYIFKRSLPDALHNLQIPTVHGDD